MHAITHGGCTNTNRVCTERWPWEKNPVLTALRNWTCTSTAPGFLVQRSPTWAIYPAPQTVEELLKKWEVPPSPILHSKPFPRQVSKANWCFMPSQPVVLYQLGVLCPVNQHGYTNGVLCPVNQYGYTNLVFYAQSNSMVIPGWISKTEHWHMKNAGNRRRNYALPPSP